MQRALSNMERAFWLLDRGHSFNGVYMLSVRGPLTEALLQAGLRRTEARHPAMRVRIAQPVPGDERKLLLTDEGAGPIPLRIVPRENADTWKSVVESELNQQFPIDSDHLTRAVWVRGETKSEIVFGQHHVTCDALSITYAVRDLLEDLSALAAGKTLPPCESLPLRPALPSLLSSSARGLRRFWHMLAFFFKHVLLRPIRWAKKLPLEKMAPPTERRSRLLHAELTPSEMRALADAAKREDTSVHGVLCAALLLSAYEVAFADRKSAVTLGCASAVSLRKELVPPVGEEMGLFISQVTTFHRVSGKKELWALSREVKNDLRTTLKNGEQYLTMPLIGMFIPTGKQPAARFIRRFDGGSPAAFAVTNIGPLPIPLKYGPFSVESCQFSVSPSGVSPLIVTASTCGEVLNLNMIHVEPLCQKERAAAILEGTLRRLRAV